MPVLILIVPLIFGILDATGQIPAIPLHRDHAPIVRPVASFTLPPNTEVIYFVSY